MAAVINPSVIRRPYMRVSASMIIHDFSHPESEMRRERT
jgi:hypothetical protein